MSLSFPSVPLGHVRKAIWRPSGDHVGQPLPLGSLVRRCSLLPSTMIVKMSPSATRSAPLLMLLSGPTRSAKAIVFELPSSPGDRFRGASSANVDGANVG